MQAGFTRGGERGIRLLLTAACVLALAACAGQTTRPPGASATQATAEPPEDQVKRRAVDRWTLLIERRFDEAYELLSPGYRQTMSKEAYIRTMKDRPVQWTRVLFSKATCEPALCVVEVQVNAQLQMPVLRVGTVDAMNMVSENWILSGGEWYLVPQSDR